MSMNIVEHLWQFIEEQLKSNNFLSGGAVLMALGAIGALCRKVPGQIFGWLKGRIVMEVEVSDRDPAFMWLAQWLAAQPYSQKRARRLTITTVNTDGGPRNVSDPAPKPRVILTPAPGTHYFRFRRHFMSLYRTQEESNNDGKPSLFKKETFSLSILTRRRELVHELLDEARRIAEPPEDDRRTIWTFQRYNNWCQTMRRRPRPIDSVILAKGVMESILDDIRRFQEEEQFYADRGIPYRRTYLLYGPPGSGKSSMVWAIASYLKRDLAVVNMAIKGMGDDDLRYCLADMPANSFGLIEDIDRIFQEREKSDDDDSPVTFSGLLNALDGVAASEGRVMFITTNHRDRLDEALLRPGRCDVHCEIGNADSSQVCRIFDRFFPDATPAQTFGFVDQVPPGKVSMAALQGHLTKYRHDIEAAIKHAGQLCTN
jgi:chaperone BCS1